MLSGGRVPDFRWERRVGLGLVRLGYFLYLKLIYAFLLWRFQFGAWTQTQILTFAIQTFTFLIKPTQVIVR